MKKLKEELKYGKKGITLISLVVTIIVLIILASVTINVLFGENGLITMAQKAKNEYEEAAKNEEQQLAGVFGKNFADYNGQLRVEGTDLVNQYGEKFQLKGFSMPSSISTYSNNVNFSYYLNNESIDSLKQWGTNIIRLGLTINELKLNNEELKEDLYNTIDLLIEKDMYILIVFWNSEDITENTSLAKLYFEELANNYKDIPNIIYEIANEPPNEWDEIKDYSNTLISTIRNITQNNIIIIPNRDADTNPNIVVLEELSDSKNIMVSFHMYVANGLREERITNLETAIQSNIPIFVTEWGTNSTVKDGFSEEYTNAFVEIMNKYNLSWCNYHLGDYNFRVGYGTGLKDNYLGIVKHHEWNNSLDDNILTESGKYIKSIIQSNSNVNSNYAIMIERDNSKAFWQDDYRSLITSIEFKKEKEIPENALIYWDISFINKENVYAYILQGNEEYKLYIISDYTINFPITCGSVYSIGLFQDFSNLKEIIFNNVKTSNVTDCYKMFYNCSNLEKIVGLENFDTSSVQWMGDMFLHCTNLTSINTTGWDVSRVSTMTNMFAGCESLANIDGIENWNTDNLHDMNFMFQQTYSLYADNGELDLRNWNVENVESMQLTFAWCGAKNINISNWNMSNVKNIFRMFRTTDSNLENLYMNNVTLNIDMIENYEELFPYVKDTANIYVANEEIAKFIKARLEEYSLTANVYYGSETN